MTIRPSPTDHALPRMVQTRRFTLLVVTLATLGGTGTLALNAAADGKAEHWVGTWTAAPQPFIPGTLQTFDHQSLRLIVHASLGGTRLRVRISNTYGEEPLHVGAAHVARRRLGADIEPNSDRELTFKGDRTVTVPKGSSMLSDPVDLQVPDLSDLAVSLYLPVATAAATSHFLALQTNYVSSKHGDVTGATEFPVERTTSSWPFLTGVDVVAPAGKYAIVAFGDSTVDGDGSTPDANHRWPDVLAARLQPVTGRPPGILNEGIIGNRLLRDSPTRSAVGSGAAFGVAGLARFDRDALAQPGVRWLIVRLGINDIGFPGTFTPVDERVTAQCLIAGYRQLIVRAHKKGILVMGATLTPFENATVATGFFTAKKEALREKINAWFRTSNEFDAEVDLDALLRDPEHPQRLLPQYDSGDHLHPNDTGYAATANAIPLTGFHD